MICDGRIRPFVLDYDWELFWNIRTAKLVRISSIKGMGNESPGQTFYLLPGLSKAEVVIRGRILKEPGL